MQVNALKNAAPASQSAGTFAMVSGNTCAASAKSTTERLARCVAFSRKSVTVRMGWLCVCSITVVIPPAAAALDPWMKSSRSVEPGSMK